MYPASCSSAARQSSCATPALPPAPPPAPAAPPPRARGTSSAPPFSTPHPRRAARSRASASDSPSSAAARAAGTRAYAASSSAAARARRRSATASASGAARAPHWWPASACHVPAASRFHKNRSRRHAASHSGSARFASGRRFHRKRASSLLCVCVCARVRVCVAVGVVAVVRFNEGPAAGSENVARGTRMGGAVGARHTRKMQQRTNKPPPSPEGLLLLSPSCPAQKSCLRRRGARVCRGCSQVVVVDVAEQVQRRGPVLGREHVGVARLFTTGVLWWEQAQHGAAPAAGAQSGRVSATRQGTTTGQRLTAP